MVTLINTAMSLNEVSAFVARLKMAGYKVNSFGHDGHSVEVDGLQVFRATSQGNERYAVRFHGGVFPDV